ncbi:XRE family transcriptional regulator [Microbispora triticiradicis]|uniref:Helix-turn-helix domain-containing protein n=4 Tax=Streptosporangiaceae TaxID=2004 RepID=A0ABY3LWF7_9ACTN|nr:helix-turn-helix domain-containing protein [Microbispora triticiradicis]RGA04706.1 XRE family transcriptional regulator [Microbispora triticiradicis]TLP58609.1 helix-turn-helix domain-containing protein [Microbispora fusca]TYB57735.1 helix-turn-helix domain-containing protein [Microbispora tritici]GLW21276.1 transcriptional regulator [Microbispora amethystogenes]
MSIDPPGSGSTVRRIMLGASLRRLREERGLTREVAGFHIRASESKISRMELGRVGFKTRDVEDLLTLYGVHDDDERRGLLEMVREANTPGWWHKYGEVLPNWFVTYVGLEEASSVIRTYEVQFVPGLLQTAKYARSVIQLGHPDATEDTLDQRVNLRLQRQERLTRKDGPRLWAVIDEAALRRPIGGSATMREQLQHLLEVSTLPNITLQVMPLRYGMHAAEGGAFTILRFPESDLSDVVYVEQLWGALYLDKREDIDPYLTAMEQLCVESTTPGGTAEILGDLLRET